MMAKRRLFVAVPIVGATELQQALPGLHGAFSGYRVRWLGADEWHVTLWFVGNIEAGAVDALVHDLSVVAGACDGFEVSITGFGVFGAEAHPRILWAGVEGGEGLLRLQQAVVPWELMIKPFVPHITLGRFGRDHGGVWPAEWWQGNVHRAMDVVRVRCFSLYESVLMPGGSVYRRLRDFELRGSLGQ